MGAEFFLYGCADRRTDMTKVTSANDKFAKAPKMAKMFKGKYLLLNVIVF